MPLDARPDHVAIAVPDHGPAWVRWSEGLGGAVVNRFENPPAFDGVQLRYRNHAKLEILQPSAEDPDGKGFLPRFLDRFGSTVHHVTLKVPDLEPAIAELEAAGLDVVDVDRSSPLWHEAFLRPSQAGGIVIQVAWSAATSDEEWAARTGVELEPVRGDAAELLGPLLRHPDLDAAGRLWTLLGGEVRRDADRLHVTWDGAPLRVEVVQGDVAGPVGLRFRGAEELAPDDRLGPAVLPVS